MTTKPKLTLAQSQEKHANEVRRSRVKQVVEKRRTGPIEQLKPLTVPNPPTSIKTAIDELLGPLVPVRPQPLMLILPPAPIQIEQHRWNPPFPLTTFPHTPRKLGTQLIGHRQIPPPPKVAPPICNRQLQEFKSPRLQRRQVRTKRNGYVVFDTLLGSGAFSRVYLGCCERSSQEVAVKQIDIIEYDRGFQQAEIDVMKSMSSEYIVRMLDYWRDSMKIYLVLELCKGSLKDVLHDLSIDKAFDYFRQILEGVRYLHEHRILHRDIKPENILLKDDQIKISDLGMAKQLGDMSCVESMKCGTPCFMAPQILDSNFENKPIYNHKCDVWSVGVVLYEMIYKRHPFNYNKEFIKTGRRIRVSRPVEEVERVLDRCLVVDVGRRADISEVIGLARHLGRMNAEKQLENGKTLYKDHGVPSVQLEFFKVPRLKEQKHLHKKVTHNPKENSLPKNLFENPAAVNKRIDLAVDTKKKTNNPHRGLEAVPLHVQIARELESKHIKEREAYIEKRKQIEALEQPAKRGNAIRPNQLQADMEQVIYPVDKSVSAWLFRRKEAIAIAVLLFLLISLLGFS